MYKSIILFLCIIFSNCKDNLKTETINNLSIVQKNEMLDFVNKVRTTGCNCGITYMPPVKLLSWNEKLETAATLHSEDMSNNNYFDHINKQSQDPSIRITNSGYLWSICGENIAMGQLNVEQVMIDWLNSEGHCKNIMNKNFKDIGVGRVNKYWTQNFGAN